MANYLTSPRGATSNETNKESLARMFGVKKTDVGVLNTSVAVDSYSILYDKTSCKAFYRGAATGTPTSWSVSSEVMTLVTGAGTYTLYSASQEYLGDYSESTITLSSDKEYITYLGQKYKLLSSLSEYTTTGTTSTTWETDKDYLINYEEILNDANFLRDIPELYYGCFFENSTTILNIFTSHNGISMSDPIRVESTSGIYHQGVDPSIIYYKGSWLIGLTTSSTSSKIDFTILRSEDLVTWTSHNIVLNNGSAICSSTTAWDTGTIAASKLWAPEFSYDPVTDNLYLTISILLGVDSTITTSTANYFGTYLSKLTDLDSLTFSVPTRINTVDNTGTTNGWSRIDANIQYDPVNKRYIQVVKRENYSIIDTFYSSTIDGTYTYLGTIDALKTSPNTSSSGYYNYSGIEGCFPFLMRDNSTWVVGFDQNGTMEGILYVTTTDFKTFSAMSPLRMPKMRHGTMVRGDLTLDAKGVNDLFKVQTNGSGYLPTKRQALNWVQISSNVSIIPRSDTVYYISSGQYTVTLVAPSNTDVPRNFYFCCTANDRTVYMTLTGATAPGSFDIGWGSNNIQLIEFFWNRNNAVYHSTSYVTKPKTYLNLYTDAGTAVNESSITWVPRNGYSYRILDTQSEVVIYDLPNMPMGTYFNVIIQSASTNFQGLTLKAAATGNNMGLPADWVYTGGSYAKGGNDGCLIRIEKGGAAWFATPPNVAKG